MANKPTYTAVSSGQINPTTQNSNFENVASGVEGCLGRGGVSESNNSMTGNIDMNTNKIINLGIPTSPDDAASKKYVDSIATFGAGGGSLSNLLDVTIEDPLPGQGIVYDGTNWVNKVIQAPVKVAVVGDSLSQQTFRRDSWPWQFKRLCQVMGYNIQMFDFAIGGSTFNSALNSPQHRGGTTSQVQMVAEFDPDVIFVMLGINDALFIDASPAATIVANATALYNQLKTDNPNANVVYVEELPHDITQGLSPTSLQNDQSIPFSHGLITFQGLTNCRVNNATYNATPIQYLVRHQEWGTATTTIRTIFDNYVTVDLFKASRLGSNIDPFHYDSFGHSFMAHYIFKWFATNNGIDNTRLDVSNLSSYLYDPDLLYTEMTSSSVNGAATGAYNGRDIADRINTWFYGQRNFSASISPKVIANADRDITVRLEGCFPNRPLKLAWSTNNFIDPTKTTDDLGKFFHSFAPAKSLDGLGYDFTVGDKNIAYAVELADATHDVHVETLSLQSSEIYAGRDILKTKSADQPGLVFNDANPNNKITFETFHRNNVNFSNSSADFTVPTGVSRIRINCGVRFRHAVTNFVGLIENSIFCTKNSAYPTTVDVTPGAGIARNAMTRPVAFTGNVDNEVTLNTGIMDVVAGDVFSIAYLIGTSVEAGSVDSASALRMDLTYLNIEVIK